ncbi:MAG TPA: TAT-variant-translocated molybdopterin oxidoreductase [Polyangiaceae bacterium]
MSSLNGNGNKPVYWKSVAELEQTPEFREFVEREFAEPLEAEPPNSPGRRRFMELMGASLAFAGVTGCRWKEDKLMPHSRRPEGYVPGEARHYATAMDLGGFGTGLMVRSYNGRPIKVEGNPQHPTSLGASNIFHQASVLELYDPDRSRSVARFASGKRTLSSWEEFRAALRPSLEALTGAAGKGLAILSEANSSPTLADLKKRLLEKLPQARWFEYEPVSRDNERAGGVLAFGKPHRAQLALEKAAVVLSLDADVISQIHPAGLSNARALISGRVPEKGTMNRVYAVESAASLTGVMADHRLALRSELIKAFVAALDAELSAQAKPAATLGAAQPKPKAAFLEDPAVQKFLSAVAKDLAANPGKGAVVVGAQQPAEVHALVHRINAVLGNAGETVSYVEDEDAERPAHLDALKALVADMNGGAVDTLILLGGNPVYSAPVDVPFTEALGKVKTSVHLALYEDETSQRSSWHVPVSHYLEAWGDVRAWDGTVSIVQPLIAPLHGTRSTIEALAELFGDTQTKGLNIVRRTHEGALKDERAWRKAVHDGVVANSAAARATPELKPVAELEFSARELGGLEVANGQLEITFGPDYRVYDGRFANNAWLQELPDSFTKHTWDNAALFHPKTAKALGVADATLVNLSVGGRQLQMLALLSPNQAQGSVRVALGYGRKHAGTVGGKIGAEDAPPGFDTYRLRSTGLMTFGGGLSVTATGERYLVGASQDLHTIDQTGHTGVQSRLPQLIRENTFAKYKEDPNFVDHVVHHPPLLNLWKDPVKYDGHRWGLSIDLNRCIGCSACVIGCQSENNIPVVGKANVERGRELHWIRIDRYFRGTPEEAETVFQPVTCHQCENAPCESVCPVGATMHSHEGLNDMVYNRCIGTRYCSNNCPYKVRRFNYFNYHLDTTGTTPYADILDEGKNRNVKGLVYNPEVTVRARGVMEKCTFCVQRIQNVKIKAKNARRPIKDGEIKTACQQTCPTEAIVFGDLNDKTAEVTKRQAIPRSYAMLQELNTRPRLEYLARIKNPNPELG